MNKDLFMSIGGFFYDLSFLMEFFLKLGFVIVSALFILKAILFLSERGGPWTKWKKKSLNS